MENTLKESNNSVYSSLKNISVNNSLIKLKCFGFLFLFSNTSMSFALSLKHLFSTNDSPIL